MRNLPLLTAAVALFCSVAISAAEKIVTVRPSASYFHARRGGHGGSPLAAISDGKEPKSSRDQTVPRLTFWDHRGNTEWVQLDFDRPLEVTSTEIYWYDDGGAYRTPKKWKLFYNAGHDWLPIPKASPANFFGNQYHFLTAPNRYNKLTFDPVVAKGLRILVRQKPGKPGFSSGILEWKINGRSHKLADGLLEFDELKMRLAMASLLAMPGKRDPAASDAFARLDNLLETYNATRTRADLGNAAAVEKAGQTREELLGIQKKYGPHTVLKRLADADPDRCLKLMVRLDWTEQDTAAVPAAAFKPLASAVISQLGPTGMKLAERRGKLLRSVLAPNDSQWMDLYLRACESRRAIRLQEYRQAQ